MGFLLAEQDELGMRLRVEAFDWSRTALGPRADWPAELETVVQQALDSHFPKAVIWGPEKVTIYNDAFRPILGSKPDGLGRSFSAIWSEAWQQLGPIADLAYAGESTFIEDFPLDIIRGEAPERAYFTFCYSPLRLRDGTVAGMLDTVIETTSSVKMREDVELANRELAHRLKNSLAIVQSIASQTLRQGCEPQAYRSFEKRLSALAHAHDVLLGQSWSAGSLMQTVTGSLEAHAGLDRVRLSGPDLRIGSHATMAVSMMLHELAANAAKYGAMANDHGRIELEWAIDGEDFRLSWQERDGPPVRAPERRGFGTRLIERGLGAGSQGKMRFEPDGLQFTITAPVADLAH